MSDNNKEGQSRVSTIGEAPMGKVKVIGAEQRGEDKKHAVYAKVIVEDGAGKRWYYKTSCFLFDLKPYKEEMK